MRPPDDYQLAELIMSLDLTYFAIAIALLHVANFVEKLCVFIFALI